MSFASTGSSIQLIGTNAKCHSIGTRWVWIAACALDSTIQDAGAASPSPQTMHGAPAAPPCRGAGSNNAHRAGQQRKQQQLPCRDTDGPELQKRLRTLTEILREHLRHVHVPHRAVRQADRGP